MVANRDIKVMLGELAELTTLAEGTPQSFKVRAYENAARAVESASSDLASLSATQLAKIDGLGKSTAAKIRELVDTGRVEKLDDLRARFPPGVVELSKIPGLGPKTLQQIRSHLGVEDVEGLRAAIAAETLRTVPGLGATSEAKIAKAIERLGLAGKERRTPIADALPLAERLVADLAALEGVVDVMYCGSLRRFCETIGDVDVTVASTDPLAVMQRVRELPEVDEILVSGETKTSFLTSSGLQIDVRIVQPEQFGATTLYFTGSKAHNIELRQRAMDRGLVLNEYGLFEATRDGDGKATKSASEVIVARSSEAEIYAALDLATIPPPMREATGEVRAAADRTLPDLVERHHIRGDLHYHTDRSGDGRSSLVEMVKVAAEQGYEYLAITDHGEDLAINGSSQEQLLEQRDNIRALQADYPDLTILWGCELNIGASGGLDYTPEFRALFDYTVASVHSHFDQDVKVQTERLVKAIADPTVNSIGHLTGRYIGRRPGIELDIDIVIEALHHFDVALEINGALQRLDAASDVVRSAVERGVKLVINTDSHHTSELGRMEYGVLTAQRGWAPRDQVVNTWPREEFLAWARHRRR